MRNNLAWLVATLLAATGCPNIKTDPGEGPGELPPVDGPTVEFDPAHSIIPFPNNLVRTGPGGTVALPEQCHESAAAKAIRENILNKLDGFGTYESALQVTFTEPVDMASITGHVIVAKRDQNGTEVTTPAAIPEAGLVLIPGDTVRFKADCSATETVTSLTIVSLAPLDPNSTYVVALTDGIKTATGKPYSPSFTWSLVRFDEPPVTLDDAGNVLTNRTPLDPNDETQLAQLRGISLLWNAHAKAFAFLDKLGTKRNQTLVAWEFTTQTTTAPLDRSVAGSPASEVATTAFPLVLPVASTLVNRTVAPFNQCPNGENDVQCFLKCALGALAKPPAGQEHAAGDAICAQLGCANVGDILAAPTAQFKQYQTQVPNTQYTGTGSKMIPGAWTDPRTPTMVSMETVRTLMAVPAGAPPANGWPLVVFQHGLTRSKNDAVAIVSQLSSAGFAIMAIDAVAHGDRAVRISNDPAKGCADVTGSPFGDRPDKGPSPSDAPQCYAPFLSPDLGGTRDNIRQTIIDLQQAVAFAKGCGNGNACSSFKIDPSKIFYMGQSLGGIMGGMATAMVPDIRGGVLNVPAMGWVDVLENTQTLAIKCSLVDGLIDAGIVTGDKFNPAAGTGLCTTDAWKEQPGYKQFSVIGRWVLDPADPANYHTQLAQKRVLVQEVVDDKVVPNVATNNEGALLGLAAQMADSATSGTPPPSAAITVMPRTNKFVKYPTLPAAGAFPGNTFAHGSLLAPAPTPGGQTVGPDGQLGTARMQTDAITFLLLNLQ